MVPLTTPERLAVLESLNVQIRDDVTEIKHDIKELARTQSTLATELATKTAQIASELASKTASLATNLAVTQSADNALTGSRASTGIWVRAIVPWFLAGIGVTITLLHAWGVFK
jgi:acetyl-CoA carboxylase alpha subunit